MREFLMGNEILARAAFNADVQLMFGYPITPVTEVFSSWARLIEGTERIALQTEDEMAAGFGVCGAVLAGKPAFTATGGPGMVLMQDPLSMAEAMRLPMVVFNGQRGGPSTGQVIYSQQEVNLAIYGGNGEGLRVVYSTSSLQDLYDYGQKVFQTAWKYRFPTILLYDGYQGKMRGEVEIAEISNFPATPAGRQFLPRSGIPLRGTISNLETILTANTRNTYNLEEELEEVVSGIKSDFEKAATELAESETFQPEADVIVLAHGIVAAASKKAIKNLKKQGIKVGLFRPITLSPFPVTEAGKALKTAKKAVLFESSLGQFYRLLKGQVEVLLPVKTVFKPGVGFTPEEMEEILQKEIKNK